jgi:hypothetical protein
MSADDYIDFVFDLIGRVLYVAALGAALYIARTYGADFGQFLFG